MLTGQRKAVPLWMLRLEQARERIREITKAHPLSEVEVEMLAEYAEQVLNTRAGADEAERRDYSVIVDWLCGTSRISPLEHRQLQGVIERKKE